MTFFFFHCWCQPNCYTDALPDSRENCDLQSVQVCWQTKPVNILTHVHSLKSNETADTFTNCNASMCFVTACGLWHWISLETATRPYFLFNSLCPRANSCWIPLMAVGGTWPLCGSVWLSNCNEVKHQLTDTHSKQCNYMFLNVNLAVLEHVFMDFHTFS